MNIFEIDELTIWNCKQNHPELVIEDCKKYGFTESVVRQSMLARGINKWLKVRRDLIAYKKLVKHDIRDLLKQITKLKKEMSKNYCCPKDVETKKKTIWEYKKYNQLLTNYLIHKELLKHKEIVRRDLKQLCMTERWQIWERKRLQEMNTITASD